MTPAVIAHRGASWEEPENTLPAFRRAIAVGADYVEFDVHAARDGSLVVGHGWPRASHEYPTLEEVLDVVNGRVGVMLGRAGYHNPYLLAEAEAYAFGEPAHRRTRAEIVHALVPYVEAQLSQGVSLRAIARHVLGLYHGASGARAWRRILSDASQLDRGDPEAFLLALREVEPVAVPDTA